MRRVPRDPWLAGLLAVGVAHAFSLVLLWAGWLWQTQQARLPAFANVSFSEFLASWDGQWYLTIATEGYPSELPTGPDGRVEQNPWAFLPGFPIVVRLVSSLLGTDPARTGVAVNQLAAAASAVLVIDIARRLGLRGRSPAIAAALFMLPAAPVLWMVYSEALFLALTLGAVDLVLSRRYLWALTLVPLASMTRSAGAALAVTVLIVVVRSAWERRRDEPVKGAGLVLLGVAGVAFSVLFWPVTTALVTGRPDGLQATYAAWGEAPSFGLGWLPPYDVTQVTALVAVLGAVVAVWAARRHLGFVLLVHATVYLGFLLAVGSPTSATIRHLLPLVALPFALGMLPMPVVLLLTGAALKVWWVFDLVVRTTPLELFP